MLTNTEVQYVYIIPHIYLFFLYNSLYHLLQHFDIYILIFIVFLFNGYVYLVLSYCYYYLSSL